MSAVDDAVLVMGRAKYEIQSLRAKNDNLRALLELTRDYLCEMPAEVENEIRRVIDPMPAAAEVAINGPDAPVGGGK